MFLRKRLRGWIRALVIFCVTAAVLAVFVLATSLMGNGASRQGLAIAELSIRRAAVQCYALEGVYPPSYEYLQEHYGIQVSDTLYFVDYRFVADNLMPDVAVLLQSSALEEAMN